MFLLLLAAGTLYLVFGDLQEGLIAVRLRAGHARRSPCTRKARPSAPSRPCATSPARARWSSATAQPQRIAGRDVVRGDLLKLSEGDRVPADALLVSADGVQVDESLLTGEAVPVASGWQGR